jgi:hypothetical protein
VFAIFRSVSRDSFGLDDPAALVLDDNVRLAELAKFLHGRLGCPGCHLTDGCTDGSGKPVFRVGVERLRNTRR